MLKIAIVGAGPAGCTLARLLIHNKKLPIAITIFESETSLDARTQGGTLDMHSESGLEALGRCGLYDEFVKQARFDGEAITVANKDLKRFVCTDGAKDDKSMRGRPEIDRKQLRRILVDSLPEGVVRWGWHLESVEEVDGDMCLQFRGGKVEEGFDLVVGAEGAWSKIRSLLSDEKPFYTGIGGIGLHISSPQERCPYLYKLVNRGSLFAFSDSKSLMAQQLGDGSLSVSTWSVQPEDYIKILDGKTEDFQFVNARLRKQYEGWHPQLLEIIEMADGLIVPRNLYMLPIGTTWKHRIGLTMLGDAAHLMSPFAGEGVNLAMSDAMSLANAISNAAESLSSSSGSEYDARVLLSAHVKTFEEDMFKRATKVQQLTFDMMEAMFFMPGGPSIERWLLAAVGHDLNFVVRWMLAAAVYTYFFFWRRWHGVGVKVWLW